MPDAPEELLNQRYQCPDCAAEGLGPKLGSEFSWPKAPKYRDGVRRNNYCKAHQSKRTSASRAKRLAESPKDGPVWEAKRATDRRYVDRNRDEWRKKQAERSRLWRQRHPEQARLSVAAWAEKNRAKRKESQNAFVQRRRLRGVRPIRGKRREEGGDGQ
jgi:hypothetical protein